MLPKTEKIKKNALLQTFLSACASAFACPFNNNKNLSHSLVFPKSEKKKKILIIIIKKMKNKKENSKEERQYEALVIFHDEFHSEI